MDFLSLGIDLAIGIDISMKMLPRRQQVLDLDTSDLDHPVARAGIEACGLGVQNDFARHVGVLKRFADRVQWSLRPVGALPQADAGLPLHRPGAPDRIADRGEDFGHSQPGSLDTGVGLDDEIGPPALFCVGSLAGEEGRQLGVAHSRAR
jgi:hypothetical protein